ncbi:MAG: permease [Bacteroidetes bacterium MedPE-SWsnd-G1]|nr:MAG: permease [Bacteroidetes bacterium MedPE-SWsnd-G1]
MGIIEIFGYVGALLIGIVLGLIGGGGSILTVPILVYLLHIHPVTATAYSLFVVGSSALVGTVKNVKKKKVDFKAAFIFAIPAFIAVYISRKYIVPAIPEEIVLFTYFTLSKHTAIMLLFAIIMLLSSFAMINGRNGDVENENYATNLNIPLIIIQAILIGFITGIIGAGGGFLIIPALVMLVKIPMKRAVATSLLIVSINSLIGFLGDVQNIEIDWVFLLLFSAFSIVGMYIGLYLNNFIEGKKLKKGFGWFVLAMGIYILIKEFSRQ